MNEQATEMPPDNTGAMVHVENPPPATRSETEFREITPAQARVESIAAVLDSAYRNASTLQLTPEESKALMEEFDDEDIRTGARGDDRLIYLEHQAVRRRLLQVFGPGQWTIIRRREWLDEAAGWLYADVVLVCRGCFVGECIGAMRYSAKNNRTNYADAVKGAESDALGRIAGTALGVGLQLWSKGFSEQWHERQRHKSSQSRQSYPQPPPPPPTPQRAPQANVERKPASSGDVLPKVASEARREQVWKYLTGQFQEEEMYSYFTARGWSQNDWPLKDVPASNNELAVLVRQMNEFLEARQCPPSDDVSKNLDKDSDLPPEIADSIITVPRRGSKRDEYLKNPDTIGSLYRAMKDGDNEAQKRLWGLVKGWQPEPYVSPTNGKKYPVSNEDAQCRVDLDVFADWYADKHGEGDAQ